MRAWVAFLSLEMRGVHLLIHFAAPPKFSVIFRSVQSIALDALGALYSAREGSVSPLLAIFALGDSWIHVRPSYSSDIPADVKAPIDEALSFVTALMIPSVDPDYWHVRLGGYFNNPWSRREFNIVEYLILFQDIFNITCIEAILSFAIREEGNADDLEVWFWLREAGFLNLQLVNVFWSLYVLAYNLEIRLVSDFVSDDYWTNWVGSDEVYRNIRLGVSEKSVDVSNM